ncbi:MAG: hypothetical protein WBG54_03620 [Acidobacteriaceae bacterium]
MKIASSAWTLVFLVSAGLAGPASLATAQTSGPARTAANHALRATMQADGSYELDFPAAGWKLQGKLPDITGKLRESAGTDSIGAFHQISASFLNGARTAEIRVYETEPLALFRDEWRAAGANAVPFPSFERLPEDASRLSFRQENFAPYEFGKLGPEGPWTFFDKQDHAMILSPADHFLVSTMEAQPDGTATSGIVSEIQQIPAGFSHGTLIAAGTGINRVFSIWGSALLALGGKQRPANDANVTLARLGYWTDNRTTYYYKFDPKLGYAGTLLAVRDEFNKLGLPLGYLQLDSWFYPKGPDSRWNEGGSTLEYGEDEYRADKTLFPQGLEAFQRDLGLPLVTHARWVSPQSPYHREYKMSGNVVIDPKFWSQTADYLHQAGVVTYEQDWLDHNSHTALNLTDPPLFLGEMARSMASEGITIQYCMPLPSDYMASTLYPDVQTTRTSDDGFERGQWDEFLYDSRLATALGLWPWTDAFFSKDLGNLIISTLSAGPVGVGDALGSVDAAHLHAAARSDGVIIKPDTSLLPIDAVYQRDAAGEQAPMVAAAATNFGDLKIQYVFAYPRQASDSQVTVPLRDLDVTGSVFAYNWVTHQGQILPPDDSLNLEVTDGWAYQVLTPVTRSGLALLGDTDKIAPLSRAIIKNLTASEDGLSATIQFARGETEETISGYAARRPAIRAVSGAAKNLTYSEQTHLFTARVTPGNSGTAKIDITAH